MRGDILLYYGQPKPCTIGFLPCDKRLEQRLADLGRDAGTIIPDDEGDLFPLLVTGRRDIDAGAGGLMIQQRVRGIAHQVHDTTLQLAFVAKDL